MPSETWRPVVGYEQFYEVSDQGRVRSLVKRMRWDPRVLAQSISTRYAMVSLNKHGTVKKVYVHALVAEAFIGPRPDGLLVCHNDGDCRNNVVANLRYDTYRENSLDTVRHGTNYWANLTHCLRGHEFTPENTRLSRGGRTRNCRACEQIRRAA